MQNQEVKTESRNGKIHKIVNILLLAVGVGALITTIFFGESTQSLFCKIGCVVIVFFSVIELIITLVESREKNHIYKSIATIVVFSVLALMLFSEY